jgi:hypothetical protein
MNPAIILPTLRKRARTSDKPDANIKIASADLTKSTIRKSALNARVYRIKHFIEICNATILVVETGKQQIK